MVTKLRPEPVRMEQTDEDLAYFLETDPKDNAESRPPENETVRMLSLCLAEIYTPSTVSGLIRGVERLGWVHDDPFSSPHVRLPEWIRQIRATYGRGAIATIGYVRDTNDTRRQLPRPLQAPLPDGVDHLWVWLLGLTPSVTCLVVQFVLKDDDSLCLDRILRRDFRGRAEPRDHGRAYYGAAHVKEEALQEERGRMRSLCSSWVREYLPGVFSEGITDHGLPTLEMLTFNEAPPFQWQDNHGIADYRWLLRVDSDADAYESSSLPGWRLSLREASLHPPPFLIRLGGLWKEVAAKSDGEADGDTHAVARAAGRRLVGFVSRFALHCLLAGYEERLGEVRDSAGQALPNRSRDAVRGIDALRQLLANQTSDAQVVGTELAEMCESENFYGWETADFAAVAEWGRELEGSLVESMRTSQARRALNVVRSDSLARESISTAAQLMSSSMNVRFTRTVVWLTWVLVFLTVVAVVLTATSD